MKNFTLKRVFMAAAVALCALSATALPVEPGAWKTIKLTDGSTVRAEHRGGHGFNFYMDSWENMYFLVDAKNDLYEKRDREKMTELYEKRQDELNVRRNAAPKKLRGGISLKDKSLFQGKRKGLVILMQFPDKQFWPEHDKAFYNRVCNERNFSEAPFKESVKDYFLNVSGGQFEMDFDIVGPYTSKNEWKYYGENKSGLTGGEDQHPVLLGYEAVVAASEVVDFSDYDWDEDGECDQVIVIYANFGEANSGVTDAIWQFEGSFASNMKTTYNNGGTTFTKNGKTTKVNTFCMTSELRGIRAYDADNNYVLVDSVVDGIGAMCHEFSHCLGYPDHYNATSGRSSSLQYFDLMDCGNYLDPYQPAGYTAFERWTAGWIEPIELTDPTKVEGMKALSDGGTAYVIYCDSLYVPIIGQDADGVDIVTGKHYDPTLTSVLRQPFYQFYIMENRQPIGCDAALANVGYNGARGLLVSHVTYHPNFWAKNTVNSSLSNSDADTRIARNWAVVAGRTDIDYQGTGLNYSMSATPYPYDPANVFTGYMERNGYGSLYDAIVAYNQALGVEGLIYNPEKNDSLTSTSKPYLFEYAYATKGEQGATKNKWHKIPMEDRDITKITQNADGTISFIFRHYEDDATGIREVTASEEKEGKVYTLSGQAVQTKQLPRGVYIRNGKKFIVN